MIIRQATVDDALELLSIYAQYIATSITFESTLPDQDEFKRRIRDISKQYPYVVCEESGAIVGYAYAYRYRERQAYQWSAELSAYLSRNFTSRGIGKKLSRILIEILKLQGVRNVYGCVALPNDKSEGLLGSLGFSVAGTYHNAGYKDGGWHDVRWFEKQISEYGHAPKPIIPISEISGGTIEKIFGSFCD